jgi:zinc protease
VSSRIYCVFLAKELRTAMKWKTLAALLVGALALGSASPGTAAPKSASMPTIPIVSWQLKNGLRVVFSPHRRVPVVTVQVWYHVGSKNEHKGIRGVAHMFEHLMFKGSKSVRPERHARMLTALGGSINAFTTNDVTAYHNTLPRQYLGFALRLEAERMRNLLLTPAALKSEREVVKEEKRQRMENSPIGRSLEAIHALSYTKHPYAWTPAGDIGDLESTKLATYQRFYQTYYAPNNATLVVVGDVSEKDVRSLAQKVFGAIPRGKARPKVGAVEPPQKAQRVQRADWASQLNVVLGAYHVPPAKHDDIAPLAVLSTILSSGRSSRLYKQLVRRKKLAVAAGGFVRELEHPGLFYLYALGLPGKSGVDKLQRALLDQVALVQKKGVSKAELAKAKNQLTTGQLRGISTVTGLANQIGESTYLHGDPKAFLDDLQQLSKVTAKDVQRVATQYLQPTNFSVVLLPAGAGKSAGKTAGKTSRKAATKKAGGAK